MSICEFEDGVSSKICFHVKTVIAKNGYGYSFSNRINHDLDFETHEATSRSSQ